MCVRDKVMSNHYTVYKHISPSNKIYIGITSVEVESRWRNGIGYKHNNHFYNAILKYGWENIRHEILFTNLSKKEAEQKEIELIRQYKSNQRPFGYNIENGGNTKKVSEETKIKMSIAHKGKRYKKRRLHTEEEKKAISDKLKNRISPMKGKQWSIEQRARVGTPVICKESNEEFYSLKEAERITGINHVLIARCCKGISTKAGGLTFEYKNQ